MPSVLLVFHVIDGVLGRIERFLHLLDCLFSNRAGIVLKFFDARQGVVKIAGQLVYPFSHDSSDAVDPFEDRDSDAAIVPPQTATGRRRFDPSKSIVKPYKRPAAMYEML
jgi:hypothetical protein